MNDALFKPWGILPKGYGDDETEPGEFVEIPVPPDGFVWMVSADDGVGRTPITDVITIAPSGIVSLLIDSGFYTLDEEE